MRVGILGGSFNPAHLGHIHISNLALKKLALNQVWWIPTLQNPLKQEGIYTSYEDRILACEKLLQKIPKLKLKKIPEISSYKLLQKLQAEYPEIEFFWIMGADNLQNLHKWKNFKKFLNLANLAIFSRADHLAKIKKMPAWNFIKKERCQIFLSKNLNISSTEIRKNLNV